MERLNADIEQFRIETESEFATLYEDAFTTRKVKDFKLTKTGVLTWNEEGTKEREQMYDDDEAKEWIKFWRANLRRAKRYWAMDCETLDAIQEGEIEDKDNED